MQFFLSAIIYKERHEKKAETETEKEKNKPRRRRKPFSYCVCHLDSILFLLFSIETICSSLARVHYSEMRWLMSDKQKKLRSEINGSKLKKGREANWKLYLWWHCYRRVITWNMFNLETSWNVSYSLVVSSFLFCSSFIQSFVGREWETYSEQVWRKPKRRKLI